MHPIHYTYSYTHYAFLKALQRDGFQFQSKDGIEFELNEWRVSAYFYLFLCLGHLSVVWKKDMSIFQ